MDTNGRLKSPSPFVEGLSSVTILVGHAGVGKTNTALGIALACAERGDDVTLADLDVVNPYFRSSDYPELLSSRGIRLVAPVFARTTLDTPSLTGELDAVIADIAAGSGTRLVIDAGGDEDGATALGRYADVLAPASSRVLYAVSAFRALTTTAAEAAALVPGIEAHCRLHVNAVLNTSNLGAETTLRNVEHGRTFARECADLLGLPLVATVIPEVALTDAASDVVFNVLTENGERTEELLVMPKYVSTPWDTF